ncbi:Uncharacterized conserved protein, DUF58 family, contains vWF domain [Sanguibacter gelidistatuariae]|uniref:Uncharacterized conserved protein, DUF58 family, contains vWF domain n=1 Tax=Sanguibacter gelidistatuariae TaxID=1814289 RepID=A0A1G6VU85_9MICO|nr:DUF58 domain-containing protein [Sanguibacter gelidistatuariae]SDD57139.1 Uncharacterized conserved protein, DUF58 family, contains vWF domain [Sanguibacter gelidistatuariae]
MVLTWRAVALTALGIVPVLLSGDLGMVVVWTVVVVVVACGDALLAASPRLVSIQRTVPRSVRLTEHAQSVLVVTNESRRTFTGVVRDAWAPSAGAQANRHAVTVPVGEARRLTTLLVPTRRGDRPADRVTLRAFGPLGVAGRQASIPVPGVLRVLPEFASRKHLPSRLARLREMDGQAAVQIRGEGTEFDSLREYVIGDDVRSIDWRASARRTEMVVRTWRPERDRRVLIVIDTARTSAARIGDQPRLDASIEAGLLLGALAAKAGDRVELIAFDRTVRARVAGAAGPRLLPALANAMAPLEPALLETDWPGLVALVRERLSQRALVVLLSSVEPAAIETGLLPVVDQLSSVHQVVLASVSDPDEAQMAARRESASDVFDAAAAARTELERIAATMVLNRRGVEVVSALPDDLAPRLADMYLSLKAAGRL